MPPLSKLQYSTVSVDVHVRKVAVALITISDILLHSNQDHTHTVIGVSTHKLISASGKKLKYMYVPMV